jgi:hypothetical protein
MLLLLAFPEQPGHIAGLGNLGEIDLRLELARRRSFPGGGAGSRREMLAHPFSFILLKRARVSLFLRDSHFIEHIEDRLAFYLKLSGQIIDSNFHPPVFPPNFLLRDHNDLTVFNLTPARARENSLR